MEASVVLPVAQWIGSLLMQEAGVLCKVEHHVKGLQDELELMQQYLQDLDAKQDLREVRVWRRQIRTLAYNAEDVIDTYILNVVARAEQGNWNWFIRFSRLLYNAPRVYKVGKQIQAIQDDLKQFIDKFNSFGVRRISELENGFQSSRDERRWKRKPRSYPYADDGREYVVGLEKDILQLVEKLMGEGHNQMSILSIVGMGGSGKTTLAKKLYNHPFTNECFDCKAWVSISQEWSTQHVLSEILRKVGGPVEMIKMHAGSSVEEFVDKLRSILTKKSYLVVLDDVWRREALEEIFPALPQENINRGSKIIITTRNREIIQFPFLQHNQYIYEPRPLSEEEAWDLFSKITLGHCTNYNFGGFESLGKEMIKKCDGLPLAIVALSGILSTKRSIREWQQVSEAVRSRLMEGTGSLNYGRVGDLLALSYDDLPYDLKPCFLYLGVFPEDCQIPAGMLTRMWIAEGLISTHEEMTPEDVAAQCLEELSHRFMIQVVRTNFKGEIKVVRLHDLLRDLCVKKAKEQSFLEVYTPINDPTTIDMSALAIQPHRAALHSCLSFPAKVSHLRSLVLLARSSIVLSAYVYKDTLDLGAVHNNFKLLRLLNLWGIKTLDGTLPAQVGHLIHLRYLGIRCTNVTEIPRSIGNLRNLLTLDYRNIESSREGPIKIPDVFWKLVHLRHLFLPIEWPWAWNIEELKLSTLKNLRTLWGVKQDGGGDWLSRELPKLSVTLKKLKIFVSREKDLAVTFRCPSLRSDGLHTFHCELRDGIPLRDVEVLSNLQHLYKLKLIGELQMELSLILPTNIVILELRDSKLHNVDPMTALGALAHLKLLRLSNFYDGTTFTCDPGSFAQLEELYLQNFQNLDTWRIEKGAMLSLKSLEIINCKKLRHFPQGLVFVTSLQQLDFFGVPKEFSQKAREYGWSQKRLRLPHNCEAILEKCDSSVDISSVRKLYDQLAAGVFLNNKKKKFWVMMQGDRYYNCFMMYAAELSLATEVDCDLLPIWVAPMDDWGWEWSEMAERDGALIKVAKLKKHLRCFHTKGEVSIEDLSPHATYRITYVIMLDGIESEQQMSFKSIIWLPCSTPQSHKENLNDKPMGEWLHICVGEFETSLKVVGEVKFSTHCQWPNDSNVRFAIKGVIIKPRL